MPTVEDFEVQVYKVERVRVRLKHPDGKDVRGDKQGLRAYDVDSPRPDSFTVRDFKDFLRQHFVGIGIEVEVLDARGRLAHGNMLLEKLRSQ